ncbi:uncharacterized protein ARMOST_18460 [Armillaria ostoyae]|uniref:Uncharacterized protein n=1 Tax=Armillaria ostoyae TaxID=47428 RepID=A0A284S1U1_ARMOS|nr:uncharacterized protein ARMOST_18460 [Armillaria ostoyae]
MSTRLLLDAGRSSCIVIRPSLVCAAEDEQSPRVGYLLKRARRNIHLDGFRIRAGGFRGILGKARPLCPTLVDPQNVPSESDGEREHGLPPRSGSRIELAGLLGLGDFFTRLPSSNSTSDVLAISSSTVTPLLDLFLRLSDVNDALAHSPLWRMSSKFAVFVI